MRHLLICFLTIGLFASCKSGKNDQPGNKDNTSKAVEGVSSNGVNIAYNKCGTGDTTLLFVHGWCINKEYWEPQMKFFCPRYTVVAIDLPGFGESGKNRTDWSFNAYTDDIKKVIEDLHLKNVILVGHSMSGDLLLTGDNKYPNLLAGIVGIDNMQQPGIEYDSARNRENDAFFEVMASQFDSTVKLFMSDFLFRPSTPAAIKSRVMNDVFTCDSSIAIKVLRANTIVSQMEKPLMKTLTHKLYLVNSDVNPIKGDSLTKYLAKGYHAELIHDTGHYPMLEKPDLFNAALQKVIDAIGSGK